MTRRGPEQDRPPVVISHDYLTQRGGAERVLLSICSAFPDAPVVTSLYNAGATFEECRGLPLAVSSINRIKLFRDHHRVALPLYPAVFGRTTVDADVTICSTSGFAHGVRATGKKLLYVYNTPRWLYQAEEYLGPGRLKRGLLSLAAGPLKRWDREAALSATQVLSISNAVKKRIWQNWGLDSTVLYPPYGIAVEGQQSAAPGLDPGFVLVVARLLPYKRVDAVIAAMEQLPGLRLVIVGAGPERHRLERAAGDNVSFMGDVSEAELRWLYSSAGVLVAAAHEDLGLAPLEAAAFGTPSAVVSAGGFLETVVDGRTGVFFDTAEPHRVAEAIGRVLGDVWDQGDLRAQAEKFSEASFAKALRAVVRDLRDGSP